ncbi:MAG: urate hydroxylase PuuD [Proteobacteria bacterium]|nr:urate hydroxylase PuuD [Pseudomonadota bacterium]
MEAYVLEWVSLIFRWLHLITGIAWIGASFYFVWLDNSLEEPPQWKKDKGIKGDLWAIHGGGIYEIAKYHNEPEKMPTTLHWFKWEAYTTWLTGMVLLTVIYYLGAESYLIDKRVADLSQMQAVGIGLLFLSGSWVFYELLCRSPLAKNGYAIASVLIVAAVLASYTLTHLFSGRGAYIHMGAIIGTIMVGNVFRVIIPSQKALLVAIERGEKPDPKWGARAKLHSTHNTYLTLPLLFIMISAHYPMTYTHHFNWLVLLVIIAITAVARQYFVLQHKHIKMPVLLVGAALATALLAYVIAPDSAVPVDRENTATITDEAMLAIIRARCTSCHSTSPTDDVFTIAPGAVTLDDLEAVKQWAPRIKVRTVDASDMPFMNKTEMTGEERAQIAGWLSARAR